MDTQGRYTAEIAPWAGTHVFDANPLVIRALKDAGRVVRHETVDHPYPHCWRCAKPLVYRAVSSWFVQVTAFRDRMVELNQEITWVPEHIKDGSFGKWLANARDWSISRNRFWGSPIPVWKSDDPRYPRVDVYGSLDELERDWCPTHRPPPPDGRRARAAQPGRPVGRSMMRAVPEVLDCWFESGSMPYAQVQIPFENQEWFEDHYPGDFIVEYIGQTRGWFYTLHVLATALFDRPAFRTCISHGILLGDDGQKMSKSLRNYPDPFAVFDTYGSDAMRWYLLSSPVLRGGDLVVSESGIRDSVRQVLLPLWNAWSFLSLYANAAGTVGRERTDATDVLDRYLLAKTHELVVAVTECMDASDLYGACAAVRAHLDSLTNWYIRRSRSRFWAGEQDAIDPLHTVLSMLVRVAAPLLPLVTEHVSRALTGGRSVHLADWPDPADLPADPGLVAAMDRAREVCSVALSVRKANALRVRQPLASLTVATPDAAALTPFAGLVADEVNVKDVRLVEDVASVAESVLQVVPAVAGPRLGRRPDRHRCPLGLAPRRRPGRAGGLAEEGEYPPPRRRGRGSQRLAATRRRRGRARPGRHGRAGGGRATVRLAAGPARPAGRLDHLPSPSGCPSRCGAAGAP
jgi:isoleucyl-tRNA synthetase